MTPRAVNPTVWTVAILSMLATLVVTGAPASAAPAGSPTRLAGLVEEREWTLTSDGQYVVYMSIKDSRKNVYAVPPRGGSPWQLNAPLQMFGSVKQFAVSPEATKVAYIADQDIDQVNELYLVEIAGGPATKINGDLGCCSDVTDVDFSPNGEWITYQADELTDGNEQHFAIPTTGGTRHLIATPDGDNPETSPIFTGLDTVFFVTNRTLYRQPLDGSQAQPIIDDIGYVQAVPNGEYVVARRWLGAGDSELVAVPTRRGPAFAISEPASDVNLVKIMSDSDTVVFDTDEGLFTTTISDPAPRLLSDPLDPGERFWQSMADPVGSTIAYLVSGRIFVVDAFTGGPLQINTGSERSGYWIHGVSATNVIAAVDVDYVGAGVYSYATSASNEENRLSRRSDRDTFELALTPNGERVVYADRHRELFGVPVTDGAPVSLSTSIPRGQSLGGGLAITADSATVVYAIYSNKTGKSELFSVDSGLRCGGEFATIVGSNKSSTQIGTSGRDVIHSQGGDDVIKGLGGDDVICGGDGDDTVNAGSGADRVYGNRGDDIIRGRKGNDILKGGKGNDRIYGNAGRDTLRGQSGDDTLNGGKAKDICKGGKGADRLRRC